MSAMSRLLRRIAKIALAALVVAGPLSAASATKGDLLLQEDFQRHAVYTKERLPLQAGWQVRVAHGTWTRTAEGVQSMWEKGHSPVLVLEGEFGDCIVEVDFRFRAEPGKWAACRVSATNPALFPRGYAASAWANVDFKSRGRGLVLENDVWDGPIARTGYRKAEFPADTWHTLRLQLVGNRGAVECNGVRITGTHERFGLPKTTIWLGTGQSPHELRNLRIYAARPREPAAAEPMTSQ